MTNEFEITVRCNSCTALNEVLVAAVPDAYEQYGVPHCDLPAAFSCCECGRYHVSGISVAFVNSAFTS